MSSGNAVDHLTDRKRRKEEKKRLEKTLTKNAENLKIHASKSLETNCSAQQTKSEEVGATAPEGLDGLKKRKKKQKHIDI